MMKKLIFMIFVGCIGFASCSDSKEVLVPIPNDVTLNELQLERFTHQIPDGGFSSKAAHSNGVKFNTKKNTDGTYSGFAFSNRNNRSFTWTGTQQALDSNIYSVYTRYPNANGIYAVGCVKDDDTYFTLEQPAVVEHVLVANTTYDYLAMVYGNQKGTVDEPATNDNLPGAANKKGIWYTYVPGGVKQMLDEDKDYFKLTAIGYRGTSQTGSVDFYLCTRKGDPEHPDWSLVINDWYKMDLSALGMIDKVVFYLKSSDMQDGQMRTPSYFCLDGIRIRE